MSLSDTLFHLARLIAPDHRKPWIDAMQCEGAQSPIRVSWAIGAIATASGERLRDLTKTGALARTVGGTFVMGTGLTAVPFFANVVRRAYDQRIYERDARSAVGILILCAMVAGLIGTGAAIMAAGRNGPARAIAKTIVVLMGTGLGCLLTWSGWLSLKPHRHITLIQHEIMWLSLVAGPALLIAAAAMALKRPRLFLATTLIAFGAQTGQWLVELSRHMMTGIVPAAIAFYGACLPTLLMLAAAGLVIQPRPLNSR